MKVSTIFKSVLLGIALLLVSSAFASTKGNKGSLSLSEPTTVGGHQLKPGDYKLKWDGSGHIELMIFLGGKLVARVPAQSIELDAVQHDDATESRKNDDGSKSLTQIDFAGKKYALSFDNKSATDAMTSGARE